MHLDFNNYTSQTPLFEAINFLKTAIREKKPLNSYPASAIPILFIPKNIKPYLYEITEKEGIKYETLNFHKYEFLIYKLVFDELDKLTINIKNSTLFTSLEDELIPAKVFEKDKAKLLENLGFPELIKTGKETLAELKNILESLYIEVNEEIANDKNKAFKTKIKNNIETWSLAYEKIDKVDTKFFSKFPKIDILDVIFFAKKQIKCMGAFKHALNQNVKKIKNEYAIIMAILARANNLGKYKMSNCCDSSYNDLKEADAAYISKDNLKTACNIVIESIKKLPMYKNYQLEIDMVFSSSDGSKIETRIITIRSRYSKKYFGSRKGISAYSSIADNIPINSMLIGAHQSENIFVHDVAFNHNSCIHTNFHTTDTDGTNKVNYVLFYFRGTTYAPRYKNLFDKASNLCGFNPLSYYAKFKIKPNFLAEEKLIIKHWSTIQRYSYSVFTKKSTQSNLVYKLNKSTDSCEEKKALWEFNRILMSIHILRCIKDKNYRQKMQKALNRGEIFHKFIRAIRSYHDGKMRVSSNLEQDLNYLCSHFVSLLIIYMNTFFLSEYPDDKKIKKASPFATVHINFHGYFRQKFSKTIDSLLKIIKKIKI